MAKCGTTSGRLTFGQMYPLVGAALGQVDIIFVRSLCQADLWSDYPLVETSHGQMWYYFRQADLWSDVPSQDQALGQVDIFVRSLGQADLYSDVPPMRLWVRLTFHQTLC